MNRIFSILVIASFVIFISSCNQNNKQQKNETDNTKTGKIETEKKEQIKVYSVDELFTNADNLSDKKIKVQGIVEHICKHSAKRFKIINPNSNKELKIELINDISSVEPSIIGKSVVVSGSITATEMDAEMVEKWKQKMIKNHKGEENTEHYKEELSAIQEIYDKIISGEILFYTSYSVQADKYEIE